jgi:hypothetical protein
VDDTVSARRVKPVTFAGKISAPVNNIPPVLNYKKFITRSILSRELLKEVYKLT